MTQQASREKPGRIKRLLDNYRSLTLVTALLFIAFGLSAQQIYPLIGVRQEINAKGYDWKEGSFKVLRLPSDTLTLKVTDSGSVAYKGIMWIWTGYRWKSGCSCSADTTTTPPAPTFAITTNPVSQTVSEGSPYTFTVAATGGTTPYTYNWFKNGSSLGINSTVVSGSSATLGSAGTFYATVTDATSTTLTSTSATLTVNAALTVTYGYSPTDPYIDNSTAPTVSNPSTESITSGAQLSHSYPAAAVDKFLVIKIPASEPTPTAWYSTSLNNGSIPDAAFRAVFTVGSFKYLVSRDAAGVSFDYTVPFQFQH